MPEIAIYEGECLGVLRSEGFAGVDAVIADPPYCSGCPTDRVAKKSPVQKYQQSGTRKRYPDFAGDHLEQRALRGWSVEWMRECLRVCGDGAYLLVFTDWRQLPTVTDAVQMSGWLWRGVVSWDKGLGARSPHKSYFRHQCEFIVWATKGKFRRDLNGPWPGSFTVPINHHEKRHVTAKPLALLRQLVKCVPQGGLVLDPFAGSGTTAIACELEGRRSIAIEQSPEYAAVIRERLAEVRLRSGLIPANSCHTRGSEDSW